MKYIFDVDYILSIILALLLLCNVEIFPQTNIKTTAVSGGWNLTWNYNIPEEDFDYLIFYCQGTDTTLFPVKNGALFNNVKDWMIGTSLYNKFFCLKKTGVFTGYYYVRIGIIAKDLNDNYLPMKTIPKVIRTKG
jgi:hypothetical protein